MNDYKSRLLKIAQKDLKASCVLYDNKLYMQSIYMFQQAVEKCVKYFGLIMNIVSPNDLQTVIRHEPIKLFKKILGKHKQNLKTLNEIKQDKNIGKSKLFSWIDFDAYLKKLEESEKEIGKFSLEDIQKNKNLIIEIYNKIVEINDIEIPITKELKKNKDFINIFLRGGNFFADFASRVNPSKAYEIQLGFNYLLRNEKQRNKIIDTVLKILKIYIPTLKVNGTLILFSLLVSKLDTRLRYPVSAKQEEALNSYTKKDKFIEMLPDFQHELQLIINNLQRIHKVKRAK